MHESLPGRAAPSGDRESPPAPVLLYDGLCGVCDRTVRAILERDPDGAMRFAPLQGEFAARVLARHPSLRGIDSLVLVDRDGAGNERVRVRSDAAIAIALHLGGGWSAVRILRLVPRVLRDAAYDRFARLRYRTFGRHATCPVPAPGVRERFLA
ncbi:MAG: DCC1-like thiol-disulfide oxidoreductase family protein [Gemmatimonadota bacterium]